MSNNNENSYASNPKSLILQRLKAGEIEVSEAMRLLEQFPKEGEEQRKLKDSIKKEVQNLEQKAQKFKYNTLEYIDKLDICVDDLSDLLESIEDVVENIEEIMEDLNEYK